MSDSVPSESLVWYYLYYAGAAWRLRALSELSDVLYTHSRALNAGHDIVCPRALRPRACSSSSSSSSSSAASLAPHSESQRVSFTAYAVRHAQLWTVTMYMLTKYSLRFLLFRQAARNVPRQQPANLPAQKDTATDVREVRNPYKTHKLAEIARRHSLDEQQFVNAIQRLLRWWPLLP